MIDGDVRFVVGQDTAYSRDEVKSEQGSGKRSFTITISDDGNIEVSPSRISSKPSKAGNEAKLKLPGHVGKQRIRIALIEDDAGSSDEETPVENDAMLNGYANMYNKSLPAKPSFVVLEDNLVRKRFEDILQASAFHCNAQQQTSPCEIGSHTGSQTDDALRVKGHNRGCQVTDARSSPKKKHLHSVNQLLQHLNNLQSAAASSASSSAPSAISSDSASAATAAKAAATATATAATSRDASQVTISFVGPPSATSSVVFHPQVGQQQQLPPPVNYVCSTCGNCCCQMPACCNKLPPQYQQHRLQQLHPGLPGAIPNCCSNSTLRPVMGQTMLGPCAVPYMLPETKAHQQQHLQQQQQDYLIPSWTPRAFTPCPCCPLNPCHRCPCGNPNCPHCCAMLRNCSLCSLECQREQQMKQQQQLQKMQIQNALSKSISNAQSKQSGMVKPDAPSEVPTQGVRIQKEVKPSKQKDKSQHNPPAHAGAPLLNAKLSGYPKISRRLLAHNPRHRSMGVKTSPSKLFMTRCGRTCLILKPTMCPLPSEMQAKQEIIDIP